LTLVGLSAPEFVLATILLLFFAVSLPLFPVISVIETAKTLPDILRTLTLPAVTLAIAMGVYAIRMLRDNLIEVLDSEYVRMATLKGLPRHRVVFWHALPNALVPALNVTALNLAYLIGGVVVVERVFAYNGIGSLLVDSIFLRDAPLIEAAALLVSAIYIGANLLADVMAIVLNPRLRTA
jgi:peptide/nickel transport system permease protein